jgi:hypothetical protein
MNGLELLGIAAGAIIALTMGYAAFRIRAVPANTDATRRAVNLVFLLVFATAFGGVLIVAGIVVGVLLLALAGAVIAVAGFAALPKLGMRLQREALATVTQVRDSPR